MEKLTCPIDAITLYFLPKYFSMVLAFAGDSTMTKFSAKVVTPLHFLITKINDKRCILFLSMFLIIELQF